MFKLIPFIFISAAGVAFIESFYVTMGVLFVWGLISCLLFKSRREFKALEFIAIYNFVLVVTGIVFSISYYNRATWYSGKLFTQEQVIKVMSRIKHSNLYLSNEEAKIYQPHFETLAASHRSFENPKSLIKDLLETVVIDYEDAYQVEYLKLLFANVTVADMILFRDRIGSYDLAGNPHQHAYSFRTHFEMMRNKGIVK